LYLRLVTKYYLGNHIKNNEMGGVCSTNGDAYRVLVGKPEERYNL